MNPINLSHRKLISTIILLLPIFAFGQNTKQDSLWKPFNSFIGEWTGKGGGEPGRGDYERSYKFIYNKKLLR